MGVAASLVWKHDFREYSVWVVWNLLNVTIMWLCEIQKLFFTWILCRMNRRMKLITAGGNIAFHSRCHLCSFIHTRSCPKCHKQEVSKLIWKYGEWHMRESLLNAMWTPVKNPILFPRSFFNKIIKRDWSSFCLRQQEAVRGRRSRPK